MYLLNFNYHGLHCIIFDPDTNSDSSTYGLRVFILFPSYLPQNDQMAFLDKSLALFTYIGCKK